jgi:hypothetical protein
VSAEGFTHRPATVDDVELCVLADDGLHPGELRTSLRLP